MKRFLSLVVAALVVLAACSDDNQGATESASSSASSSVSSSSAAGDFYEVPDPLPAGEPGKLIRSEVVDGFTVGGATAYRIMYLSRSALDQPIAVTGTALIPKGDAPAGGRRLVTIAHGTTGSGDSCAPSTDPRMTELSLMAPAIEQNIAVVMSDYEGLGTPGVHPYLVAASEAHSVLDAARAAGQLPNAGTGKQYAIAGYSQGGHGALAASAEAATYAPELELVGTFAGAPPSELEMILQAGPAIPKAIGFVMMIVAGTHQAYPDADPSLVLTDEGVSMLGEVEDGCVSAVIDRFSKVPASDLFKPDTATVEPWMTRLHESDLGQVKVDSPILIIHSKTDDVVPEQLSKVVFDRMCGLGQVVERRLYDSGTHGEAAVRALPDAQQWIIDRFDGKPAVSSCGAG